MGCFERSISRRWEACRKCPFPLTQSTPPTPALILGFMVIPISWAGPWEGKPWAIVLPQLGGDGQGTKAELRLESSLALLAMHTQPCAQSGAPGWASKHAPSAKACQRLPRPPRVLGKQRLTGPAPSCLPLNGREKYRHFSPAHFLLSVLPFLDAATPQLYSGPSEPVSAGGQPLGATIASPDPHMLGQGWGWLSSISS